MGAYVREPDIARQVEAIKHFADEHHLSLHWYGEDGHTLRRPKWDELVSQFRTRRYKALIVWRCDRLASTASAFIGVVLELLRLRVDLISVCDQIGSLWNWEVRFGIQMLARFVNYCRFQKGHIDFLLDRESLLGPIRPPRRDSRRSKSSDNFVETAL